MLKLGYFTLTLHKPALWRSYLADPVLRVKTSIPFNSCTPAQEQESEETHRFNTSAFKSGISL